MDIEFDLDEFLAYLLPGALLVILAYSVFDVESVRDILNLKPIEPEFTRDLLSLSSYLGITLVAGHIASIWSRAVVQPLARKIVGDPQTAIFGGSDYAFYTADFRNLVHAKFLSVFKFPIDARGMREAAPQLIRAHVLKNNSAAITMRDRVVRTRSLCGNLTLPLILFAILLSWFGYWLEAPLPLAIAALLAAKQHLLDQREYRVINSYFIAT
jgi:hypothetical protein